MLLPTGCDKVVSKSDPTEAIREGWNYFRFGDFVSAIHSFEHAAAKAEPASDQHADALYGLGMTWDLRRPNEDRSTARDYYNQVLDLAPQSAIAPWSLLALARMEELRPVGEKIDLDAAHAAYQEVIDLYPKTAAAEEAFLYQQAMDLATLDAETSRRCAKALEQFLATHPGTKYESKVWSLISDAYWNLDRQRDRFEAGQRAFETIEVHPDDAAPDLSGIYWSLATLCEFRLGDFENAAKFYSLLLEKYPTDFRAFGAKKALERMTNVEKAIREGTPLPHFPAS